MDPDVLGGERLELALYDGELRALALPKLLPGRGLLVEADAQVVVHRSANE
jgi:hypothetical protein